jgi:hypothetical protein
VLAELELHQLDHRRHRPGAWWWSGGRGPGAHRARTAPARCWARTARRCDVAQELQERGLLAEGGGDLDAERALVANLGLAARRARSPARRRWPRGARAGRRGRWRQPESSARRCSESAAIASVAALASRSARRSRRTAAAAERSPADCTYLRSGRLITMVGPPRVGPGQGRLSSSTSQTNTYRSGRFASRR